MKPLTLCVTIDVGPPEAALGRGHEIHDDWERTETGLAILNDVFRSLEDQCGMRLPMTWFLRADRLIAEAFGDRMSLFQKFSGLIDQLTRKGHEIGWMPQVYSKGNDSVDYEDLLITHDAMKDWGLSPKSVRMGDCFHDNKTMKTLDDLDIRFDSSAMPGRRKDDFGWRMNWMGTPNEAYYPSQEDYRKPGTPHFNILEVPLSVAPIRAPYDPEPLLRYLNPCMHRRFFWQNLESLIASDSYLLFLLHPDEAVPRQANAGHPLISYSADEMKYNLRELIRISTRLERTASFRNIENLASGVFLTD